MLSDHNTKKRPKGWLALAIAVLLMVQLVCVPALAEIPNGIDYSELGRGGIETNEASETEVAEAEDYRKWAQADPRWGSIRLGSNGRTVAEAGCLVTSMTKLIIQSGYRSADEFNVATLVNWLNANGGLSSEGNLYWFKPAEMIDGFEYEGMDYNAGYTSSSYFQNKVLDYVRAGKHIVLTVKNYGHYVAVDNAKSLQEGAVYIMDSLNNTAGNADVPVTSRYSYVNRLAIYAGNNDGDSDYISRCSFSMTHLSATVLSAYASMYTLPCLVSAGEGSVEVAPLRLDQTVEVTADIVNTFGQRWYQIRTEEGEHYYVYGIQLRFVKFLNDIVVEADEPPEGTLPSGMWYSLTENVISRHRITRIVGRITDEDANVLFEGEVTPNVNGGFDISGTAIDAALRFGALEDGHYSYELIADVIAESNMTAETAVFRRIFTSPFSTGIDPLTNHRVVFMDPVNGETVEEENIAHGFYAVMPLAPVHDGAEFLGWPIEGQRIYRDVTVNASFDGFVPLGDVNCDGSVTMLDALSVMRWCMGISTPAFDPASADMDGNGAVNLQDALAIMRIAMS